MKLCGVTWYASLGGGCTCRLCFCMCMHLFVCQLHATNADLQPHGVSVRHIGLLYGYRHFESERITSADTGNISFDYFQKLLRNLIGLATIPNMEIYMKWTNHLCWWLLLEMEAGDWLIRIESISEGSKSAWAEAETHGVGGNRYPVPLQAALFGDWSWELSPLLIARWCLSWIFILVCFRPRLISWEIEGETRTFYHKRSVSPPSHSQGDAGRIAQVH